MGGGRPGGFRARDPALLRLSLRSAADPCPALPSDLDDDRALLEYLRAVAADPVLREALAVSSASLAAALDRIDAGARPSTTRLRRSALSAARYLSRIAHRPTPFGLLAGVCRARFGDGEKVRIGAAHRKAARPDMGWLTALVHGWERDDAVLPALRLVVNDLCVRRGDRLVLPCVDTGHVDTGQLDGFDRERTVRCTGPVRLALDAARSPIPHGDLVDRLRAAFPDSDRATVTGLVGQLVDGEFLLTDLHPPSTGDDPLRHVRDRLPPGFAGREALAAAGEGLAGYAGTPVGAGLDAWRTATGALHELRPDDRGIQVDLRMDADVTLPRAVATELEHAVTVARRIVPPPADPLAGYRQQAVDRYGAGVPVPVKELLDPQAGLGPPPGYLAPPGDQPVPPPAGPASARDLLLLRLAQRAATRGERELVLDDDLVRHLTNPDPDRFCYLEACAELLAGSVDALRDGDFRLVLRPANFSRPGAMSGRFLHLLPELADGVAGLARAATAGDEPVTPAQLLARPLKSRHHNVTRVPALTRTVITVGAPAGLPGHTVLTADDLGVSAEPDRFRLWSGGTELAPLACHALAPARALPNVARFLLEIGESRTPSWPLWSWGRADGLPFLPRVRLGRTVLQAARWLPDPALSDPDLDWPAWRRAFEAWRADWSVPDVVDAVRADQRVRLDLREPGRLRMLRADLRRQPDLVLQEEPLGGGWPSGWADGHATELVVPLLADRPAPTAAPRATAAPPPAAHLPGGEWLHAKLYAPAARHDELIAGHLPTLLAAAEPVTDRWHFLRYRDPDPHLRLRFHGDPTELHRDLLPALHSWAAGLLSFGMAANLVLDGYRPETARYGGPAAIGAAERVFDADSRCVLDQHALRSAGTPGIPDALLFAANVLDLAGRLLGPDRTDWLLRTFPRDGHHSAFREHRPAALRLLTPHDEWASLRAIPGGADLLALWRRRGDALAGYRRVLAGLAGPERDTAVTAVLHLHHNRLAGLDRQAERDGYAVAAGALRAHRDRLRHRR